MRLISFGCSYTYGHGLPDCPDNNGLPQLNKPSELSYPFILAKKLNYDCVNLGKSGNSNKEIWNDILTFDFQSTDVVVVVWTYYSRFCIIKSTSIRRINPWKEEEKVFYMNYSNRNDMIIDFYGRLNHVNFYLNSVGVKNYHYIIEDIEDKTPKWNTTNILGTFNKIDEADDHCHPGLLSHSTFAEKLYKQIIKDF